MSDLEILIPKMAKETMPLPDPDLLQYYQDWDNRIIWLFDEIGENVYGIIRQIIEYNRQDKDIENPYDKKPIKLVIASPGGSLECARSLISIINISDTPIITIGIGCVASAASIIYLAGHKRLAIDGAYFVFHQGSCSDLQGSYSEISAFMENYTKDIAFLTEYYKNTTDFDKELIDKKLECGDWYVRLDEALANGVVDAVIEDMSDFLS